MDEIVFVALTSFVLFVLVLWFVYCCTECCCEHEFCFALGGGRPEPPRGGPRPPGRLEGPAGADGTILRPLEFPDI